ncbi:MAG: Rne/Rng family ribonuclease [Silvanigrellales bacterium]|jgi:ribonuclease G|nr:Rne/Rng family ribonuclease [Silvanigrellales bacterium]
MVSKQLVINCTTFETRVALIEGGQVSEFYIERNKERGIVGSIYKGKIVRVLPGMQSAFIDIGLDRAAFLYGGDIQQGDDTELPDFLDEDRDKKSQSDDDEERPHRHRTFRITDLVKEGQELLVQVAKDSIGTKGARVTTYLSLPGRYVVLMPSINHIGVSRRIQTEEERSRLRGLVQRAKPDGMGVIVRTASENVDDDKITADVQFLVKLWESIRQKAQKSKAPTLVHEDLNLVFRATRDLLSRDLDRIVIDDKAAYEDLVRFLNRFSVKLGAQVQLYQGDVPVFDAYGIEMEIARALGSKVWLKSGGYLVIQQTEALTAIDVNTGRFVGSKSLGDTIAKTNLEAVKEIVLQLRLRNIGGIIILDFIDMDRPDDRDRVFFALVEELKKDKAKTSALRISEMGLVQMTRKRTEESLAQKLTISCPYCDGKGEVKSPITVAYDIIRELVREFAKVSAENFVVKAHPQVADRLLEDDAEFVDEIKTRFAKRVAIRAVSDFHLEHYEIAAMR